MASAARRSTSSSRTCRLPTIYGGWSGRWGGVEKRKLAVNVVVAFRRIEWSFHRLESSLNTLNLCCEDHALPQRYFSSAASSLNRLLTRSIVVCS